MNEILKIGERVFLKVINDKFQRLMWNTFVGLLFVSVAIYFVLQNSLEDTAGEPLLILFMFYSALNGVGIVVASKLGFSTMLLTYPIKKTLGKLIELNDRKKLADTAYYLLLLLYILANIVFLILFSYSIYCSIEYGVASELLGYLKYGLFTMFGMLVLLVSGFDNE